MAKENGTMGIGLLYCLETSAGTRPTTGYTAVTNVKSIPDFNPAPSTLDVTDLSDTEWKRYINGLKDPGSDIAIGVNMNESLISTWNSLTTSAKTAYATGKKCWFEVTVPNYSNAFFFAGLPQSVGFSGAEVDSVFEGELHIIPTACEGWTTKAN